MTKKIGRREFFKQSAQFGLTAAIGGSLIAQSRPGVGSTYFFEGQLADLTVVSGADYYKSTFKAVELLGGMDKIVSKGSKVALLPNVQRWHPGTFTKREIVRAVIRMCKKAGAAEVNVLSWLGEKNWESTGMTKALKAEGANLKLVEREEALFKQVKIPDGTAIKDAMIIKELYNNDVFIDMPITKDHAGNKFTGTMKNLMGINFPTHNRSNFHKENWTTDVNAIRHLDYCIVDLNRAVKPDLCVVDATEFIITNGPMGPGELNKPQKVIAGVDRVAVDSFCTTLWDVKAEDCTQITHAHKCGLGNMALKKIKIKEVKV